MRLESGAQLGHYKIISTLGKGGMGEVYRAKDLRLGREVAIKVLPESLAEDPDLLARFEKEAKALAVLAHPNILTIFDFGNDNGISYAVTEILDGEPLRSKISNSRLSGKQVIEISGAIAEGMSAAHSKGIIHRDLKPENIFICSDGRIKILDFGLVHWNPKVAVEQMSSASTQLPPTEVTKLMGTVPYMSPEQLSGSKIDSRTDIFSFGCILYEMISGTHPFLRKTFMETVAAILKDEPPKSSMRQYDTPPPLERILFRCLNKNPEDRYHSAKDLAYDLATLRNDFASPSPAQPEPVPSLKKPSAWPRIVTASLAILVIILAVFLLRQKQTAVPQKTERSIAVLPFSNMNTDKEDEYFSDGITEDIITNLSKIGDLKVVSRTSSMRYKNSNKTLQQIGTELKVAAVLEGSVRRQGDKLRIVAQLIDAKTDNHLWAETYDREMKDVFAIQSDVAQKIASALQAKLMPEEKKKIEQIPTQNLVAYDYYLKGRQYYLRYQTQYNENAIQFFQKAVDADPNFALAYVGLCDSYAMQKGYGVPGASFDMAMNACNKALSIDPNLAIAYATLYKVYTFYGLIQKGEEAIQTAYKLDPNNSMVIGRIGSDYQNKGNLVEAFRFTKRLLELEPTNAFGYFTMGTIYYGLADFGHAEIALKKSIELQPDFIFPYVWLARLYISQDRFNQALETAKSLNPTDSKAMFDVMGLTEAMSGNYHKAVEHFLKGHRRALEGRFAHALLKTGQIERGQKVLEETKQKILQSLKEGQRSQDLEYLAAIVFCIQGNKVKTFEHLKNACDGGYYYYQFLERDPVFESMRNDPQFQNVISRMKSKAAEARRQLGM
jgi:serine/threonine protein kinase/cytochrome c-type biogenesis protein CcmH/NrfG